MLSGVVCLHIYMFYKSLGLVKSEYVDLISSDKVKVSRRKRCWFGVMNNLTCLQLV